MKKRKTLIITLIIAALIVTGVTVWAATTAGTQGDPLIARSYLTDRYTPELLAKIDAKIASEQSSVNAKYQELLGTIDGNSVSKTDVFSVVTLSNGQVLTCDVGTEIMLRIGSAVANGSSSPALIDETTAASVSSGTSISVNHMYMVTINGNGIKATADNVKVVIRGNYTIG